MTIERRVEPLVLRVAASGVPAVNESKGKPLFPPVDGNFGRDRRHNSAFPICVDGPRPRPPVTWRLVERNDAAEALALLRKVVDRARDDSALQNWGLIWKLHAFTNGGGFIATNLMLWEGFTDWRPFAIMWTCIVALNIGLIFVLRKKAGTRSFVDRAIWSIWSTFIAAVILLAILNEMLGLAVGFLAPVVAVMASMGFCTMGAVIARGWYFPAALFAAAGLVMALPGARHYKFIILGVLWGGCQFAAGVVLDRAKRRALAEHESTPSLV